jgi:ribosomal protein S12 methylthiotransferase accessory factor
MEIDIRLGDGRKVDASWGKFRVPTDQGVKSGGEASAPEPYDLFLASLGACAGSSVLGFCRARDIPADDIRLVQRVIRDPEKKRLARVEIEIILPADFPEKYEDAVVRAAEACSVKKTVLDPPEFAVSARRG